MIKRQTDKWNMLLTVEKHFNDNPAIWSSNVLISEAKTALSAKLEEFIEMAGSQSRTSRGATNDKVAIRKDLEEKALYISTAVSAYAFLNAGKKELYNTVLINKSKLLQFREAELLLYVERLDEAARLELENLGPYGITADTIAELTASRTAFYDIMTVPKEVTTRRKDATKAVAVLLQEAISILDNSMDRLVVVLKASEPDFVKIYFMARKIVRIGTRSRSLEITTVNAADNAPLEGVQIEVVDHNIKRISGKNGKNRVQNLKEGNYTLKVSHPDFVSQLIPFTIINHETTQLVVKLEKEASEFLST